MTALRTCCRLLSAAGPAVAATFACAVAVSGAPPEPSAEPTLEAAWESPPPEARVRAYWWWLNGNVDAAAITRDLEQMAAKGFGGAILCDAGGAEQRGNLPVPAGPVFGSPAWRQLLKHALAEADRLGLELSLNIQSGWNLGGPGVPVEDAVKKLVTSELEVAGPGPVDVVLPAPQAVGGYYRDLFVLVYPIAPDKAPSGGVADWRQKTLEAKLAFSGPQAFFLTNSAPRTDALVRAEADRPGEEDLRSAHVVDLTGKFGADGRLRWTAGAGHWRVLRLGCTLADVHEVSTHSDGWAGYALDVFDRGAFERYAASVVVPLLEDARPYRSLRYLHTDSWEVDLVNWTPTLRAEFTRRRGYDPLAYLPAFAGRIVDSRSTTNRFLNDYRKTLGDLAVDHHYLPFRDLARRYGLGFHPESGGPHYTPIDAQRCLGLNDIPMSEFWARSPSHRTTEQSRFFVKQPASAAHTYGKRLVAAEGFTDIGLHWQETLWDNLKPSFDHAVGEGLNRLVWHAVVCSPASMGMPGQQYFAGTHFNPNTTWWEQSGPFLAYLNRCQAMMQRGLFVADVLYYYGDHVPNFAQSKASDPAEAGSGYDYDVITEDALLTRVQVRDGRFVLPDGMSYRVLVLADERTISLPVLRKVRAWVEEGALVLGPRPTASGSLSGQPESDVEVGRLAQELWETGVGPAKGRVLSNRTARQVLQANGVEEDVVYRTEPGGAQLDTLHRREGGTDIYFVASRLREPISAEVSFRVSGRAPELWDPVTGERRYAAAYQSSGSRTTVPLQLPGFGSLVIVFREPAERHPPTRSSNAVDLTPLIEFTGPWEVAFDPKWGGPARAQFETLSPWNTRPEPGVRFFSGTATYRKTVTVSSVPGASRLWLDLGGIRDVATVRLNGKTAGTVWAPPFRVDVTGLVVPGENRLEVDVTNSWANRIIGDASLPEAKRLTRTNITQLTAQTPLMESGLLGPVRLLKSGLLGRRLRRAACPH